jgi:hypothetical protein
MTIAGSPTRIWWCSECGNMREQLSTFKKANEFPVVRGVLFHRERTSSLLFGATLGRDSARVQDPFCLAASGGRAGARSPVARRLRRGAD